MIEQDGVSTLIMLRCTLNVVWTVLPPGRRVAASPVLAIAISMLPLARWEAKIVSIKNVLPQPPRASRKHKPL